MARNRSTKDGLFLSLFFAQCTTKNIRDGSVKFSRTKIPLNKFTTDTTFKELVHVINNVVSRLSYKRDERLTNRAININGIVPSIYIFFGDYKMFAVQVKSHWEKAMMEVERVENDKDFFCVGSELKNSRMMITVGMLVMVHLPRKQTENEKISDMCTEKEWLNLCKQKKHRQ